MLFCFKTFEYFFRRKYFLSASLLPLSAFNIHAEDVEEFKRANGYYNENRLERIMAIFKKNENGVVHYELKNAIQMVKYGAFFGALFGATMYSRAYYTNFIDCSDAKVFFDVKDANKMLARHCMKGMTIGILKVAPLFAAYSGCYSLICSCFQMYRNKTGIAEYAAGGFFVGMIFRFFYGLKGMFIGGVLGLLLGTIHALLFYGLINFLGINPTEYKCAQNKLYFK